MKTSLILLALKSYRTRTQAAIEKIDTRPGWVAARLQSMSDNMIRLILRIEEENYPDPLYQEMEDFIRDLARIQSPVYIHAIEQARDLIKKVDKS